MRPTAVLLLMLALFLWLIAGGCVPLSPYVIDSSPRTDSEAWCHDTSIARAGWIKEAKTRFDDPFVMICHGGNNSNGTWTDYPDDPRRSRPVETLAWDLHLAMPNRDIVLIVCNAGGEKIRVPRVWYATAKVDLLPHDLQCPKGWADSIWQFRCDG